MSLRKKKIKPFTPIFGRQKMGKYGTLSVYLLCRLLTVSCFQKNKFDIIVNSGSQSNSKVQLTLRPNKKNIGGPGNVCKKN